MCSSNIFIVRGFICKTYLVRRIPVSLRKQVLLCASGAVGLPLLRPLLCQADHVDRRRFPSEQIRSQHYGISLGWVPHMGETKLQQTHFWIITLVWISAPHPPLPFSKKRKFAPLSSSAPLQIMVLLRVWRLGFDSEVHQPEVGYHQLHRQGIRPGAGA